MQCPLIINKTQAEERQICLNCPLPHCVVDPGSSNSTLPLRDIQIRYLARQGATVAQLASLFDLSRRTIQRTLNLEPRT